MLLLLRTGRLAITAGALIYAAACTDTPASPTQIAGITIGVNVTGVERPTRFLVSVDGGAPRLVTEAQNLSVTPAPRGPHTVAIVDLPLNCQVQGGNPITVEPAANGVGVVNFSVICVSTRGTIAFAVTVDGHAGTPSFELEVDDTLRLSVRANSTLFLTAFSAGTHFVKLLSTPQFCHVAGEARATVVVITGGLAVDTAKVSFAIACEPPTLGGDTLATIVFERSGYLALMSEDDVAPVLLTPGVSPSWSPDGTFIAFERAHCADFFGCDDDLWLIHPDGTGARSITSLDAANDYDVAVSPDAHSVAFIRFWFGPDETYLLVTNLEGESPRTLSIWNPSGTPAWSPDGSEIAFTCSLQAPWSPDLCIVKTSVGCQGYPPGDCALAITPLLSTNGAESDPAWSPDGKRVAFTLGCSQSLCPSGVEPNNPYVAVVDRSTFAVTRLVPGTNPTWSRDGRRILFVGNKKDPGLRIYNLDDATVKTLTNDPLDRSPAWR